MTKLNRLFITTWGYPTKTAKGNPFVKEMAESIARRGVRVVVIVLSFKGLRSLVNAPRNNWSTSDYIEVREVTVMNLIPGFLRIPRLQRILAIQQVSKQLEKIKRSVGEPDAFQIHYIRHSSCWLFEEFIRKNHLKYILFEHSPGSSFLRSDSLNRGGFKNFLDIKSFVQGASLRIARIKKYQEKLEELYQSTFQTLPSFISNEFTQLSNGHLAKRKGQDSRFTFIGIGSLIKNKGYGLLIDSFSLAFKEDKNVDLVILGDGPLKADLLSKVSKHNMTNQIKLMGLVSKQSVFEHILSANVVVVSSAWETFGNTVIEGMLLGKPVLSTKCDGPETIITKETGILCERTVESMSDALKWMYENHGKFDSNLISEYCVNNYSEEKVMNKLSDYYLDNLGLVL